ncbi:sensor histidine kinase [Glutamicibacter ardleyensis]|uniref:sensor histidine kinase n=1 Tax=Glutamicibacter ardleyensis TaxID=225894 RepID=UPI003FCEFA85
MHIQSYWRGVLVRFNHEIRQADVVYENTLRKAGQQRKLITHDVLASMLIVLVLWMTIPTPDPTLRITQITLGVVAITGVGLRHLYPRIGFTLAFVSTVVAAVFGLTVDPLLLAGIALNSVAAQRGRRAFAPWMLGVACVGACIALFLDVSGSEDDMRNVLFSGITLCVAWTMGVKTRTARELTAANAAIQERMRLARDVHDVLSHSLGAIGVQAGIAAHIEGLGQAQLRSALREIEQLSRSSIAELKTLLRATRGTEDDDAFAAALPELLAETAHTAEQSGVLTTVTATGIEELPAAYRVTTHRLVREAVSNLIRHSGATRCDIKVHASDRSVSVTVTDNGRGDISHGNGGFGLMGMQERVNLLGGTFQAGTLPAGGFEVSAVLPLAKCEDGDHE